MYNVTNLDYQDYFRRSKIPDLANKISVTIKPSKAIAKGDIITLKGMTNMVTNDNGTIDIT